MRGIIEADDIGELLFCGIHLMDIVFAFYFIFPIVYRLICKKSQQRKSKDFRLFTFQYNTSSADWAVSA